MALDSWILARAELRLRPTPSAGRHGPRIYFEKQNYRLGRGLGTVFLGLELISGECEAGEMQAWGPVCETRKASELLVSHLLATYLLSTLYMAGTEKKAVSKAKGLPSGCLSSCLQ